MFIAGVKTVPQPETDLLRRLVAYGELTKPRIAALVLAVAVAGFWVGSAGTPDPRRLAGTILGVALLAGGIFALNQHFERHLDGVMRRTENRPLPAGRITPAESLRFGWTLSVAGLAVLGATTNLLSAAVGTVTLASYLFIYTPLKTKTPHCTLIGAFPGAAPPLLGWVAARGQLSVEAWALFAILFFWQFPHFHSIALLYRDDYARANIRLWTVVDPGGAMVGRQIVGFTLLLLPASLAPALLGMGGPVYGCGAAILGLAFLFLSVRTARAKSRVEAQRLLLASVLYLPVLLALLVLNK